MRVVFATLLASLVFACPLICGGDEIGHGAQHDAASGGGEEHAPDQCPDGADNCVCRGAVQANDARPNVQPDIMVGLLVDLTHRLVLASPTRHLTPDGSPTGLASWGGSLTIRAYLQNFRF